MKTEEFRLLRLYLEKTNKQIAKEIGVSSHTIKENMKRERFTDQLTAKVIRSYGDIIVSDEFKTFCRLYKEVTAND